MPIEHNSNLEGINFTAPESPEESARDQFLSWMMKHGKKIVIITEAIVLLVFLSRFKLDGDINNLVEKLDTNQSIIESTLPLELEYAEVNDKVKIIQNLTEKQTDWGKTIEDFNSKIPRNEITVENILFTQGQLAFSGVAQSAEGFQGLATVFIADPKVKSMVLRSSVFNPESSTYTFSLVIEFENNTNASSF